ncbi:hypothetical protein CUMW_018550 [Citrus unshiu]|nr:hypothetical protein CUMW_018550 [Citrus unshiu]
MHGDGNGKVRSCYLQLLHLSHVLEIDDDELVEIPGLLLRLQLILHENITDMYKSDYNWDQHTSKLMERCPDFNPLKYSRDVYSSHWDKVADCLHSILFEEGNTPTCIVGVRSAALQVGEQQLSPLGQRPSGLILSSLFTCT